MMTIDRLPTTTAYGEIAELASRLAEHAAAMHVFVTADNPIGGRLLAQTRYDVLEAFATLELYMESPAALAEVWHMKSGG